MAHLKKKTLPRAKITAKCFIALISKADYAKNCHVLIKNGKLLKFLGHESECSRVHTFACVKYKQLSLQSVCLDVGIKSSPIVFPTNSLKSNFNLKSDIFKTGPKLLNLLKIAQSVHTACRPKSFIFKPQLDRYLIGETISLSQI